MKVFAYFLIFLMFLVVGVSACDTENKRRAPDSKRLELDTNSEYFDQNYKIYTLEGCEYIVVGLGNTRWGSHKGNCKNPVHYEKK